MTKKMRTMVTINHWYNEICFQDQLDLIPDAVNFFENELMSARSELNISGSLEQAASRLPGIFEYRYSQFQELEAIVEYLNIKLRKIKKERLEYYTTKYNRDLSAREAEKYVEGDDDYVDFSFLLNRFALLRNQFSGLLKSLDHKNWQVSNVVKLRCAGLDDAKI